MDTQADKRFSWRKSSWSERIQRAICGKVLQLQRPTQDITNWLQQAGWGRIQPHPSTHTGRSRKALICLCVHLSFSILSRMKSSKFFNSLHERVEIISLLPVKGNAWTMNNSGNEFSYKYCIFWTVLVFVLKLLYALERGLHSTIIPKHGRAVLQHRATSEYGRHSVWQLWFTGQSGAKDI